MMPSQRPAARNGLVLFALAMGGFAIGTTEFASMSLLPYFAHDLGISEPTASHVISIYALGVVVGAPIIAVLAARLRRKAILLILMAVFAVGNGLTALSPSYEMMLLFRFLSGLPHGAYFGVAALVAVSLVPPEKRAQAVARVMLGLSVSTIIGVPLANAVGQWMGWRWGFAIVAALALLTVALVARYAPRGKPNPAASPLRELGALLRGQVWLTLGIGAIGFGGLFAVYTYLASTLLEVTRVPSATIPLFLGLFGVGLTVGNLAAAWAADRIQMWAAGAVLVWSAIALGLYTVAAPSAWMMAVAVALVGFGGGLGPVLQTRLMDVAGDAQTLAAALNHSAFNFANALGPWLAGMGLAAGWGWTSTGWVGSLLSIGGLILWGWAMITARKPRSVPSQA